MIRVGKAGYIVTDGRCISRTRLLLEELTKAIVVFWAPLTKVLVPSDRMFWLYFVSAYGIALGVFLHASSRWSLAGVWACLKAFFPKRIWLHRSAKTDYKMLFINNLLQFYLVPLVVVNSALLAAVTLGALKGITGVEGLAWDPSWQSRVALTARLADRLGLRNIFLSLSAT